NRQRPEAHLLGDVLKARETILDAAIEIKPHRDAARGPWPVEVMADEDVRQTIPIDVGDADAASGVVRRVLVLPLKVRVGCGNFLKVALAVIDEYPPAMMPAGQEDVGPAVAVDIGRRHAESGDLLRQAHLAGDVLELHAAEIAEQPRATLAALEETLADQQIQQPVA